MKLRIKGNSIRLRITRSEVLKLIAAGRIEETVYFAPSAEYSLTYALVSEAALNSPQIRSRSSEVAIVVPKEQAVTWAETDRVGIYAKIDVGLHGTLDISVEKDFACLDRSDADNIDTFPHPMAGAVC